jgi:hypothetical protein
MQSSNRLLNGYRLVEPPCDLRLWQHSDDEVARYGEWFERVRSERRRVLEAAVTATDGFEGWRASLASSR